MSAVGYPDYQRITQWLGSPLAQGTGVVLNAGTHTDGPLEAANFASVVVAVKAIGGSVDVTIKQTVPGGPASLILTETVHVPAGATLFEAFVLFGAAVELDLTGGGAGTSVDYALYPSNTTTNAQVITAATIDFQHNDVLIAAEAALDLEDAGAFIWTFADDVAGKRMKVTPPRRVTGHVNGAGGIIAGTGFTVSRLGAGQYGITFTPAFAAIPCVVSTSDNNTGPVFTTQEANGAPGSIQINLVSGGVTADSPFFFIAEAMG